MYPITSIFGEIDKVHTVAHNGIDLAMTNGTLILSFTSGVVERISDEGDRGLGKAVWIRLADGYHVVFGHLSDVLVRVGDHVGIRSVIGQSGNTGYSTRPHLHIGILSPNGHWIDPSRYVAIDQMQNPSVIYGMGNWSDHLVSGWFNQLGDSIGRGLQHVAISLFHFLDGNMPEIAVTALVIGGFLKMIGSRTWAPRMFVVGGVGIAWVILL